jgi:hypothetical protein
MSIDYRRDIQQWATIEGQHNPEKPWLLSNLDTWEKNPSYVGEPVPHPEDYDPRDDYEYSDTFVLWHRDRFEIHFTKIDENTVKVEFGRTVTPYEFALNEQATKSAEEARDLWKVSIAAGWVRSDNRLADFRYVEEEEEPSPSCQEHDQDEQYQEEDFEKYCMDKEAH